MEIAGNKQRCPPRMEAGKWADWKIFMLNNSTKSSTNSNLVRDIQEQSFLIYLGNKTALFSTLLKKLTLGWGKIFTRAELIKILNSLAKKGLVELQPRSLDLAIKPLNRPKLE